MAVRKQPAYNPSMKLKVLIRPESVGGFSVSVPALPGCHSQGETSDEAMANIREAAELWLEVAFTVTAEGDDKTPWPI
jgi:predicted RNase H-like HicB family nuclease